LQKDLPSHPANYANTKPIGFSLVAFVFAGWFLEGADLIRRLSLGRDKRLERKKPLKEGQDNENDIQGFRLG
jgi:hypothetical protein